jgi:hypothetical protein
MEAVRSFIIGHWFHSWEIWSGLVYFVWMCRDTLGFLSGTSLRELYEIGCF